MTVTLPAPYGKADWQNYVDYWREQDAEWIQERLVLRVADDAGRNALLQTRGALVFNNASGMLELCTAPGVSGTPPTYQMMTPHPESLATMVESGKTTISHVDAGGKGVVFGATTGIGITDKLNVMDGTLIVEGGSAGYIGIKSGANGEARLTTVTGVVTPPTSVSATLVSNAPLSMPSLTLTGAGTVINATGKAVAVGALSAATGTFSGAVSVAGALTVTGAGSVIGGVGLTGNKVTASNGMDSNGGAFYGNGGAAVMAHVSRAGTYVIVNASGVGINGGGFFDVYNQMRVLGAAAAILHYNTNKNIAPSFYSATDLGVANFPEGTIWIS